MRKNAGGDGESRCSLLNSRSGNSGGRPGPWAAKSRTNCSTRVQALNATSTGVEGINRGLGEIVRPTMEATEVYFFG